MPSDDVRTPGTSPPPTTLATRIAAERDHDSFMALLADAWAALCAPGRFAVNFRAAIGTIETITHMLEKRAAEAEHYQRARLRSQQLTVGAPANRIVDLRAALGRFVALRDRLALDVLPIEAAEAAAKIDQTARLKRVAAGYAAHNSAIHAAFAAAQPLIEAAREQNRLRKEISSIHMSAAFHGIDHRTLIDAPVGPNYRITSLFGSDNTLAALLRVPGIAPPDADAAPPWAYNEGGPT